MIRPSFVGVVSLLSGKCWVRWLAGVVLAVFAAATAWAAHGDTPARSLRVVGGLGALNQFKRLEAPFWSRELHELSAGRYSAEIVPFERAGIRGAEMLSLVQSGVVPFGTLRLSQAGVMAPMLGAADLAGLNPDMDSLQRSVAAFRGFLARELRERHGVELLAVYAYPAKVVFCNRPISGWQALRGLRVRTASLSQVDLVLALGGHPVPTALADVVPHLSAGNIDCAVTGAMSGYAFGLHEQTSHVHTMALSWGLAVFVAQSAAWASLPSDLRTLLLRELPRLERRIWADSQRETGEGLHCVTGAAGCSETRPGASRRSITAVTPSAADEQLRRELFANVVLPRWVQRCGAACAAVWNSTLASVVGVSARQP